MTGSHSAKVGMDMQHFFIVNDAVNFSNDIQYLTQGFVEMNQLTMFTPAGEEPDQSGLRPGHLRARPVDVEAG